MERTNYLRANTNSSDTLAKAMHERNLKNEGINATYTSSPTGGRWLDALQPVLAMQPHPEETFQFDAEELEFLGEWFEYFHGWFRASDLSDRFITVFAYSNPERSVMNISGILNTFIWEGCKVAAARGILTPPALHELAAYSEILREWKVKHEAGVVQKIREAQKIRNVLSKKGVSSRAY